MERNSGAISLATAAHSSCAKNLRLGCAIALSTVGINCVAMIIGLRINDGYIDASLVGYVAAGTGLANCVSAPVITIFLCCTLDLHASAEHSSQQVQDFCHGMLIAAVYGCFSSCIVLIGCASCAMDISFPSGCCQGFELTRFSPEARNGVVFGVCAMLFAFSPLLASVCESGAKCAHLATYYKNDFTGMAVITVGAVIAQGTYALGNKLRTTFFSSTHENAENVQETATPLIA